MGGKIKSIWTSPMQLAFPGVQARMKLRDLLGDRHLEMPLAEQKAWKKQLQDATNAFNDERNDVQRKLDESYDPKIEVGNFVLLKETRDKEKKIRTYKINIYKVISRKNRKAVIKPLFGPPELRSKLYEVYVGYLTKFEQSELLKHLPLKLRTALGGNIPLKEGNDLPEQMWDFSHTQRGRLQAMIDKRARRKKKGGKTPIPVPSSDSDSTTDAESSDGDLPYGLGRSDKHRSIWTRSGGPLDNTYRPDADDYRPEPEFPQETDSEVPEVVPARGKKKGVVVPVPSEGESVLTETSDPKPKKKKKWYQKLIKRRKRPKNKGQK